MRCQNCWFNNACLLRVKLTLSHGWRVAQPVQLLHISTVRTGRQIELKLKSTTPKSRWKQWQHEWKEKMRGCGEGLNDAGSVARAARTLAKGTWHNHISILHHSVLSLSHVKTYRWKMIKVWKRRPTSAVFVLHVEDLVRLFGLTA
jgi:hypothetical protein